MRVTDLILKKRNGAVLSFKELEFLVMGYVKNEIPDYQIASFLMAVYFRGLNENETIDLTKAMIGSGETLDFAAVSDNLVDKHSTGGVGDKTTLVVAPLVAAAGVKVAKLSGRGLGHTGGTIDKMESLAGFSADLEESKFIDQVNEIGIAIGGQTKNLVPADKKIYALRDVTGTVDNNSLVAASIMSKKIASGAQSIVLDVKTGSGAFTSEESDAFELAELMVRIGNGFNRNTTAFITDMNQPLGFAVGNLNELVEAMDTLRNNGPTDLLELSITLATEMLVQSGSFDQDNAHSKIKELLTSGAGYNKLVEMLQAQGATKLTDTYLPYSSLPVVLEMEGYISSIDAQAIGKAAMILEAGRETKESVINHEAGIILKKKIGQMVSLNEPVAYLYSENQERLSAAKEMVEKAIEISSSVVEEPKLVKGKVLGSGEIVRF